MRAASLLFAACAVASASTPAPTSYTIATVAGGAYGGDGLAAPAAFLGSPEGLAADGAGNVYLSDALDHRIRKVDSSGVISTVAGDGYAGFRGDDGAAAAARLDSPYGLALDRSGNLYVADLGNARVRRISPEGAIGTVAGGGADDPAAGGLATGVRLKQPRNVAVDAAGNLYISDFGDHRVYRVAPSGVITVMAGLGWAGAVPDEEAVPATAAPLNAPAGLAVDKTGALYVADSGNARIRKIAAGVLTTVATPGLSLGLPTGVALDAAGGLYVADKALATVFELTPAPAAPVLGPEVLTEPREIVFDPAGNLYIADSRPGERSAIGVVRRVSTAGVLSVYAGGTDFRPFGDGGPPLRAHFDSPSGIAVAKDGTLYIADRAAGRVRKLAGGVVTTAAPGLGAPAGLALDSSGALLIADPGANCIRRLTPGNVLSRFAGSCDTGSAGYSGDGDPAAAARLNGPEDVAVDAAGNVFIADTLNHAVRQVLPDGTILTIAGNGTAGDSGDGGPASSARLSGPSGVAVDAAGNLYVADTGNHAVRRIDPLGMIRTVAGTGLPGYGGDGGPANLAELRSPARAVPDGAGRLFVADTGNQRIRVVASDGTISTIAGAGVAGFEGDGGPALSAELNEPTDLALGAQGHVLIADRENRAIRELSPQAVPPPAVQSNLVNAASLLPGAVAPGELVSLFGTDLGPGEGASAHVGASGLLETALGDTQVLFGGTPAPLLYVQYSRINAQVPYEAAGKGSIEIEIRRGGASKARLSTVVADAAPALFTADASGTGQAAALNEDGTANSTRSPAAPGSVVTLYATGEGQTSPAGVNGRLAAVPYPAPLLSVTVTVGGHEAAVLFAAGAPGYVGLLQVNIRVPSALVSGAREVVLKVGSAQSRPGVTIAIR